MPFLMRSKIIVIQSSSLPTVSYSLTTRVNSSSPSFSMAKPSAAMSLACAGGRAVGRVRLVRLERLVRCGCARRQRGVCLCVWARQANADPQGAPCMAHTADRWGGPREAPVRGLPNRAM